MSDVSLPQGARVLHIGPFKTGSTAVQFAMHTAREPLVEQGVRYLSKNRHEAIAARHAVDLLLPGQDPAEAERRWRRVVRDLRSAGRERRVYSSEYLCLADERQVERIAADVGIDEAYVVVTVRPLASLLPSQYQQLLQGDLTLRYEPWLRAIFDEPEAANPTPSFWHRHRHDELVSRWAGAFGPEHVVVVVLDDRDHSWTARAFEQLLALRTGTLSFDDVPTNRSLTWPEAEVLRHYNLQYQEAGVHPGLYRLLAKHAVKHVKLRTPGADEPRISTPSWAVERANVLGREMAANLQASGARVLGDLALLGGVPAPATATAEPTSIDTTVAARIAVGQAIAAEKFVPRGRLATDE